MEEMHGHPLHFFVSIPLQLKSILLMGWLLPLSIK